MAHIPYEKVTPQFKLEQDRQFLKGAKISDIFIVIISIFAALVFFATIIFLLVATSGNFITADGLSLGIKILRFMLLFLIEGIVIFGCFLRMRYLYGVSEALRAVPSEEVLSVKERKLIVTNIEIYVKRRRSHYPQNRIIEIIASENGNSVRYYYVIHSGNL
ncbi:MAG: hypothetical protein J6Z36_00470, partial [Clostridia bacterium]|nr:hypothetical protein [Clostridia bacterium]